MKELLFLINVLLVSTSFDFGFALTKFLFPKDEIEKLQEFMFY